MSYIPVDVNMTKEMLSFVTKYCRMCAVELKAGVFIFGEEGKRLHLPEKIRKTLAILVLEEDSLPKKICTDCCSSLEDYAQYKDTVLDAQEKLASIAKNLESAQNDCEPKSSAIHHTQSEPRKLLKKSDGESRTAAVAVDEEPSSSKLRSSAEFPLRCGFCPSSADIFKDRQKVMAHILKTHGEMRHRVPRFRCTECPKITDKYNILRLHVRRHRSRDRTTVDSPAATTGPKNTTESQRFAKHDAQGYESHTVSSKETGHQFRGRQEHASSRHELPKETDEVESSQDFSDSSVVGCVEDDDVTEDSCADDMSTENQRCVTPTVENVEGPHHKSFPKVPVFVARSGDVKDVDRENQQFKKFHALAQDSLESTINGNEDKAKEKVWQCHVCNKVLTSNTGYHNHMMVHKGRRFDCDQCGVSYMQKATLMHHKKVHHISVLKKYKCSACDKEFHELKFLTQHAKIHSTPSQEFQCNICQKIYKTGRCLRRHVKLHTSTKKYVCNLCGKAFRVKSKLEEHENSHTGKRPLGCQFCDKAFNGHPNYVKHIRRKHPNEINRDNKIPPPKKIDVRATDSAPSHNSEPPAPLPPQQACLGAVPAPAHICDLQHQTQQQPQPQPTSYLSVSGKNFVNPSGGGSSGTSGPACTGPGSSVNALELMDCAIQNALVGESNGNPNAYDNSTMRSQNEPMELSYKLESSFQDMPMELTKVFQRDPLELCVRQDLNPLMDLSSRVDTSGIVSMSMNMAGVNVHKLDLTERELMDLSGAFRQPIDLISRSDDTPHDLYNEGSLVDLSLRSTFGQDQTASSFLRELIDLSARSDSFHGELDLTKPHHSHGSTHHQQQNQSNGVSSTGATNTNVSPKTGTGGNSVGNSLQNVVYQDAMFSLQN